MYIFYISWGSAAVHTMQTDICSSAGNKFHLGWFRPNVLENQGQTTKRKGEETREERGEKGCNNEIYKKKIYIYYRNDYLIEFFVLMKYYIFKAVTNFGS